MTLTAKQQQNKVDRLSPNVYENPVNIYVKNGFAYGVERDESKS